MRHLPCGFWMTGAIPFLCFPRSAPLGRLLGSLVLVTCLVSAEREAIRLGDLARDGWTALATPPATYQDNGSDRLGLLILLHGAGGNERSWANIADLPTLADRHQRIIVSASCGPYSWYVDHDAAGEAVNRAETALVTAMLPALDARFRTLAGERWITGLSMGGYGALRLGLRRPDLFSAVGALSPCCRPSLWDTRWNLNKAMGPAAGRTGYDLIVTPEQAALYRRPLSIVCGNEDFFYEECLALHTALEIAQIPHHWVDSAVGGHDSRFWSAWLPQQLDVFARLAQPAPLTAPAER